MGLKYHTRYTLDEAMRVTRTGSRDGVDMTILNATTVIGSWGRLHIDADGKVLELTDVPDNVEGDGYKHIVRVDLAEWRKAYPNETFNGCDILDIGYWLDDARYEPPSLDWRAEWAWYCDSVAKGR